MGDCLLIPPSNSTDKQPAECDDVCDCEDCEDEEKPLYRKCPARGGEGSWFRENWTYVVFSGIGTFFFVLAVGGTILRKLFWKVNGEQIPRRSQRSYNVMRQYFCRSPICTSAQTKNSDSGKELSGRASLRPRTTRRRRMVKTCSSEPCKCRTFTTLIKSR